MENWVKIIELSELKNKQSVAMSLSGVTLLLVYANDNIYCVENRCSHEDFPLSDGVIEDGTIECPEHGSKFDLQTGQPSCFPATSPIATYRVKIENGFVYCNLNRE